MTVETWKPILGWENYAEVSNKGNIRTLDRIYTRPNGEKRFYKGSIKSQRVNRNKYFVVDLCLGNKKLTRLVHHVVLEAFVGSSPNPIGTSKNCSICNHIDGNKLNNNVENLEWVNHSQNLQHAYNSGLMPNKIGLPNFKNKGAGNGMSKLDEEKAKQIKTLLAQGVKQAEIALRFDISPTTVTQIKQGKKWKDR